MLTFRRVSKLLIFRQLGFLHFGGALVNQMQRIWACRASARGHGGTVVMSCRDTIHLICWYLEGRLSPPVANEIKRHLDTCSDCHMVLDAAMSTLDRYFTPIKGSDEEPAPQAA